MSSHSPFIDIESVTDSSLAGAVRNSVTEKL
jgi:hypothetical protein